MYNKIIDSILNKKEESLINIATVVTVTPLTIKFPPDTTAIPAVVLSHLIGIKVNSRVLVNRFRKQFIITGVISDNAYPIGSIDYVIKASDTSRSSTTTVSNDPHLVLTLQPYGIYDIEAYIITASTSETPDIKVDWETTNLTALMGDGRLVLGAATGITSYGDVPVLMQNYVLSTDVSYGMDATGENFIFEKMLLSTGADVGTLQFRWAQVTSDATATIVKDGSYLRALKIDNNN